MQYSMDILEAKRTICDSDIDQNNGTDNRTTWLCWL